LSLSVKWGYGSALDISHLQLGTVVRHQHADAETHREHKRRRRLWKLFVAMAVPLGWLWYRMLTHNPIRLGMPDWVRRTPRSSCRSVEW
jgi:hypothetical protein